MKNVILIFLGSLVPFICADNDITCVSNYYSSFTVCWKNREIIHVNQTAPHDYLPIIDSNIDSITPNAFKDLSIRHLKLVLPQKQWGEIAVTPLGIQPKSFEGLRQVKTLSIYQGVLQLEHNMFAALESLEYLLMSHCNLTFAKDGSFTGLPRMKTLIITFRKSLKIFPGIFTGLNELVHLYLPDNNITTIRKNIFNHMKHLDILRLSENQISNIEAGSFDGMSITILDLKNNRLKVIPTGAFNGVSIDLLALYKNPIVNITRNAFGYSSVKQLQYNGRNVTIDKQLVGLGELTILDGNFD